MSSASILLLFYPHHILRCGDCWRYMVSRLMSVSFIAVVLSLLHRGHPNDEDLMKLKGFAENLHLK